MAELLGLFLDELPERASAVMRAWESGEAQGLRRLAHQLKGSCGGYGYPEIGAAAGRVEAMVQAGAALEGVAAEVRELVELCRQAGRGGV